MDSHYYATDYDHRLNLNINNLVGRNLEYGVGKMMKELDQQIARISIESAKDIVNYKGPWTCDAYYEYDRKIESLRATELGRCLKNNFPGKISLKAIDKLIDKFQEKYFEENSLTAMDLRPRNISCPQVGKKSTNCILKKVAFPSK